MRIKIQFEEPLPKQEVWYAIPDSKLHPAPSKNKSLKGKKSKNNRSSGSEKNFTVKVLKKVLVKDFKLNTEDEFTIVLKLEGIELFENSRIGDILKENETLSICMTKKRQRSSESTQSIKSARSPKKQDVQNTKNHKNKEDSGSILNPAKRIKIFEKATAQSSKTKVKETNISDNLKAVKELNLVITKPVEESNKSKTAKRNERKRKITKLYKNKEKITSNITSKKNDHGSSGITVPRIPTSNPKKPNSGIKYDELKLLIGNGNVDSGSASFPETAEHNIEGVLVKDTIPSKNVFQPEQAITKKNSDEPVLKHEDNELNSEVLEINTFKNVEPQPAVAKNTYVITKIEHMNEYNPGWRTSKEHRRRSFQNVVPRFLVEKEYESQLQKESNPEYNGVQELTGLYRANNNDLELDGAYKDKHISHENNIFYHQNENHNGIYASLTSHVPDNVHKNTYKQNADYLNLQETQNAISLNNNTSDDIGQEKILSSREIAHASLKESEIYNYPQATDIPPLGATIAFKLIELSDDLSATVSEFYVGVVLSVNTFEKKVQLKILKKSKQNSYCSEQQVFETPKKAVVLDYNMDLENMTFDQIKASNESESEHLMNGVCEVSNPCIESYDWDSLLDIRLIS